MSYNDVPVYFKMNYPKRKMKSPFYVLQALIFCNCFVGSYLQADPKLVWVSNFNTDETDSWNITSGNGRFQRVLYSSILTPPQGDYWLVSAQGVNKELMPPPVPYYGGKIIVTFNAYVAQPSTITVRFLRDNFNYAEVQAFSISITSNGWNSYSVPLNSFQYPSFLVSFKYSSDIQIYLDAIKITIDGSIMLCPTISSISRCGFTLDVFSNYGWSFTGTKVDWITTSAFTYLKRDFLYLGGLLKGSMNFKAVQNGQSATIQISVNQTSYQERINSGYTSFDLTASTQYTVGQTYTILITFITTSIRAQLSSLSLNVAGDMALCKCPALLTCTKLTNGVTCACNVDTCPGLNKQCIVSQFNQSADPCSCLPGYTEDSSGNCVVAGTIITDPPTTNAPQTTTMLTTSTTGAATTTTNPPTTTAPQTTTMLTTSTTGAATTTTNPPTTTAPRTTTRLTTSTTGAATTTTNSPTTTAPQTTTLLTTSTTVAVTTTTNPPKTTSSPTTTISTTSTTDTNNCGNSMPSCPMDHVVCKIENGRYLYMCEDGWKMDLIANRCVDINECTGLTPVCSWSNGVCTNTIGSYQCTCANGWIMGQNNASCVDINECTGLTPACSWSNGVCTNTNGSYQCTCASGWIVGQNNISCVDINECTGLTPACSWSNGVCTNTIGSYQCTCASGWIMGQNNASCVDINKCTSLTPVCSWSNGVCTITNGSYQCTCASGWMVGQNNASCVDVDECTGLTPPCSWSNGVCTNTIGSYQCTCASGWIMGQNNASCVDIDECTLTPACSWSNGVCTNTNGSYQCTCASGWMMGQNNASCVDINECTGLTPACSWSNGVCTNRNGSYQCTCASGWMMGQNNASCVDINECISNSPPCSWSNGVCTNTNGSYFCSCLNEWKLGQDNASCVDECNNTCVYTYTNETYTSSCNNSFQLKSNLAECFNVSECKSNNNCNWTEGVCTNSIGRFKCLCNDPWTLTENGTRCTFPARRISSATTIIVGYIPFSNAVLIRNVVPFVCKLPDVNAPVNITNCYPVGEFDPQITQFFKVGSEKLSRKKRAVNYYNNYNSTIPCFWRACNTNGSYYCSCQDYPSCVDNPCDSLQPPCSWSYGICNKTNGSYRCTCEMGWMMGKDNARCVDNPCDSLQPPCSWSHGICNKTNSSYLCTCEMGWMMGKDNASCVDNPCDSLQPPCSWSYGICNKTNGSYLCTCEKGWVMGEDNASCVDENECISKQPPCSWRNGVCTNTNGGYNCSCLNDWKMGHDNASCIDDCNNQCIYTYAEKNEIFTSVYKYNDTHTSPCNNGSQLNTNLRECFDVSKCMSNNYCSWTGGGGVCTNSAGVFKCLCNDGWILKPNRIGCTFPVGATISSSNFIKVKYIPFNDAVLISITGGIKAVGIYVCKLSDVNETVIINSSRCRPVGEFNSDWFTIGSGKSSRKKRSVNYDNPPLEEGAVYVVFYIGFTSDGQSFTSPFSEPIVTVDPSSPCVPISCYSYKNQRCNVINSTYAKCHCKNGFISFDNGLTCEDIDECSSVANTCNFKNSQCINLIGSFACSCMKGYKLNDTQGSCVDINECGMLCKAPNTTCNNTPGSYECLCNVSGSYYNTTLNACFDLNECSMSNQGCDPVRGICNNQNVFETGITYTCSCPIGYELSQDGSNSCLDINECSTLCKGRSALCINTIGSFKCSCAVGFSMNSFSQCQLNNSCNCPLNSNCTMNGSFDCTCNSGYSKNFMSNCQANDQCISTTNCMKPHQVCQNIFVNLSYTCLCRNGYEKVGDECKAIKVNVCNLSSMNNISLCPFDQQCYDTNSGFECRCQAGYVKNNLGYCQDLNECEENISACPSNAYCTNTNGSYYCQCNKGFIGENVSNSSIMHCYISNSAWSSWEQIGTCSMLCATDEKQGNLKFQRFCEAVNFSSCNDDCFKEEVCNYDLCENKIEIFKSADCEKWSNMQANVSDHSLNSNETWINKIRAWGGWKTKACGPSLVGASKFVNEDIENITKEINSLLANRNALRKAVDCNAYIQRKNSLKTQYINIYSRLTMYTAIKAALNKLKSRVDIKLNECTRGLSAIYF